MLHCLAGVPAITSRSSDGWFWIRRSGHREAGNHFGQFLQREVPGTRPDGHVLIRVFIGGALQEELIELPDQRLLEIAKRELAELLGIQGEPLFSRIARLPASMPQYYVGHRQRVATIHERAATAGGLFLTGNAYHRVGIPFCIYGGEKAAEKVVDYLSNGGGSCITRKTISPTVR